MRVSRERRDARQAKKLMRQNLKQKYQDAGEDPQDYMSSSQSSSDDELYVEEDENNAYEIVFLLPQMARFEIHTKSKCTLI